MRLQRGVLVAGMDPDLARRLARACHDRPGSVDAIAYRAKTDPDTTGPLIQALSSEGFLKAEDHRDWDGSTVTEWSTTVRGGALAGASFLKPISRAKAQALLSGVLERARAYNADPTKPMWVDRIIVFGSYLDPDAADLGDVDIAVEFSKRSTERGATLEYAKRSGRRFSSFMDELFYPEREARQILKSRSPYISLHTEDVSVFTDRWKVVYDRSVESGRAPTPSRQDPPPTAT